MVLLNRKVNDSKLGGIGTARLSLQYLAHQVANELAAKSRHVATRAHRHVNGIPPLVLGARAMDHVGPSERIRPLSARPLSNPSSRRRPLRHDRKSQLSGWT